MVSDVIMALADRTIIVPLYYWTDGLVSSRVLLIPSAQCHVPSPLSVDTRPMKRYGATVSLKSVTVWRFGSLLKRYAAVTRSAAK